MQWQQREIVTETETETETEMERRHRWQREDITHLAKTYLGAA